MTTSDADFDTTVKSREVKKIRVALLGFGNVGRAFARLLKNKQEEIARQYGIAFVVTGIATARHGIAIDHGGLDPVRCALMVKNGETLDNVHAGVPVGDNFEFIRESGADALAEITPLVPDSGQPATDHVREALGAGMHVVTANKGPAAFAYRPLVELAREKGVSFRIEGTVMDGAPVFSMLDRVLPATRVLGFRGVLNSTTNFVLTSMEEGLPPEDALRQAQALGITEDNYGYDLAGWDAAVKAALLVNVLMGGSVAPPSVTRTGIEHITTRTVIEANRQGRRFKLIAEAHSHDQEIFVRVVPRMLPLNDPLSQVNGASTALTLVTDTLGELTITLKDPTTSQTAYALLSDLILAATT